MSNSFDDGHAGARVCLVRDSALRGVLESHGNGGCWAVRFADKSSNIRATDLKLLPSDAASFEPSQAPLAKKRQASSTESLHNCETGETTECKRVFETRPVRRCVHQR